MLHLSSNIRLIRLLSGMTQEEFGQKMGANRNKQYTYEVNKAIPDELYMQRVADFANISIAELKGVELKEKDIKVIDPDNKDMVYTLTDKAAVDERDARIISLEAEVKTLKEMIEKLLQKR